MKKFGASKGLIESLSALAITLVDIAHTRLELLSIDLEDDRAHLLSLISSCYFLPYCWINLGNNFDCFHFMGKPSVMGIIFIGRIFSTGWVGNLVYCGTQDKNKT